MPLIEPCMAVRQVVSSEYVEIAITENSDKWKLDRLDQTQHFSDFYFF